MIPYKNRFYYFNINDLDYYLSTNIESSISNEILSKHHNIFIYALDIGKNMDNNISFDKYMSIVKEEVLVFIFGFLKGIDTNIKYKNYLYQMSIEYKEKCFKDFFSKCSILEN
jgi:hypothetical protein